MPIFQEQYKAPERKQDGLETSDIKNMPASINVTTFKFSFGTRKLL